MDDDQDDFDRDDGFGSRVIPDFVKKAIMTGVGAVFMSEEGLRGALGDMKMPKEAMTSLVSQADRTKNEIIHALARELRTFLQGLEIEDLMKNAMEGTTFEIHTTIKVHKNDDDDEVGLQVLSKETKLSRADDAPKKKKKRKKKSEKKKDDDAT